MPRVTVNRMQINYRDQGDPHHPVLLLIHGLGCSLKYWTCIFDAPEFSQHRILALDLPGFGLSEKPDTYDYKLSSQANLVLACLEALHIRNFSLVGHSMGGAIAILVALKAPQRVKQLFVIEPNLRANDANLSREIVTNYLEAEFVRQYQGFQTLAIETVKRWFVDFRQTNVDDYAADLLKTTAVSMYRSAESLIATTSDETLIQGFKELPLTKYFLIGEETMKNRHIPQSLADSDIHTLIVPGVGHMMMVDNPRVFNTTLAGLL